MIRTLQNRIREALDLHADGMTASQIAESVRASPESVRKALTRMGDTYVDRWELNDRQYAAVHCLAFIPDDCPHP